MSHSPYPAAQATRLRRGSFLLIAGTLLLAGGFIGAQIYILKTLTKSRDGAFVDKPLVAGPPAWVAEAAVKPTPPAPATYAVAETKTAAQEPPSLEPALALLGHVVSVQQQSTAESIQEQATRLEVIGSLTGVHLYQTYLNIGLLADAVENGVYSIADAKSVLETVGNFNDLVERELTQLPSSFQSEQDRKDLELARKVTRLLRTQTKELKAYWTTNNKDDAQRFQNAREEAWYSIKKLAKIKD